MPSDVDVAIIGAGAAGIAAGRHLRALRPDLTLIGLEAGERLGGRALTVEVGVAHLPIDLGCGWLHGGRDNAWMAIAAQMGFTLDRTPASWDGGRRDLGLNGNDEASAREAISAFFDAADRFDTDRQDVPMSSVLVRGARWNGLLEAIGTYINGVELECSSLRDYQRYNPGRGPDPRVREGYGRLIASYGANLPVTLGAAVTAVDSRGVSIRLSTTDGTIVARAVIVTVPTSVLASEAIRFDPLLPEKIEAAAALPLGVADKLFLSIPDDVRLPEDHYVMGSAEMVPTASYHVRPFGRPVIECYFGGELARDMERAGAPAAVAFAQEQLSRHFEPGTARRLTLLQMSAWAGAQHINGSYSYARPGQSDQRARLAAPVDGRLFFAGEACSRSRYSTAHGAYETGVAAAEAVAASLALPRAHGRSA